MKLLKYSVLAIAGIFALALLYVAVSAAMSLDRSYAHTQATEMLPLFAAGRSAPIARIAANNMEFRARVAGFDNPAPRGDLLLLHGFPETSIMYEPLIDAAAAAGFRVVAPDQRGYSPGARPNDRGDYSGAQLVADALAIADAVGFERFHLVGHDWGGCIGMGAA